VLVLLLNLPTVESKGPEHRALMVQAAIAAEEECKSKLNTHGEGPHASPRHKYHRPPYSLSGHAPSPAQDELLPAHPLVLDVPATLRESTLILKSPRSRPPTASPRSGTGGRSGVIGSAHRGEPRTPNRPPRIHRPTHSRRLRRLMPRLANLIPRTRVPPRVRPRAELISQDTIPPCPNEQGEGNGRRKGSGSCMHVPPFDVSSVTASEEAYGSTLKCRLHTGYVQVSPNSIHGHARAPHARAPQGGGPRGPRPRGHQARRRGSIVLLLLLLLFPFLSLLPLAAQCSRPRVPLPCERGAGP